MMGCILLAFKLIPSGESTELLLGANGSSLSPLLFRAKCSGLKKKKTKPRPCSDLIPSTTL